MTKLLEWISAATVLFALWYALITNKIKNEFTRNHPDLILYSPIIFVILFGVYAATVVLYRVFTFNDCEEAEKELIKEIDTAKSDLKRLGFQFKQQTK